MGADHYLCAECGEIFEDTVERYQYCEGCGRHYCGCSGPSCVFLVEEDLRCWLCYNPYNRVVSDKELLHFCLEELNWTRSEALERYKETKAYTDGLDTTECTCCHFDGCQTLTEPFLDAGTYRAGVCCACRTKEYRVLLDTCEHCKSRAFMERWMAPHKVMRDAGIPKDLAVNFAKRIKFNEK